VTRLLLGLSPLALLRSRRFRLTLLCSLCHIRLFQIDARRGCSALWWPECWELFTANSDEVEDAGINIERLGVVDDRAGFESFALIPNGPA
jgi:hypothetical protein